MNACDNTTQIFWKFYKIETKKTFVERGEEGRGDDPSAENPSCCCINNIMQTIGVNNC